MNATKLIGISTVILLIIIFFFSRKVWLKRSVPDSEQVDTEVAEGKNEETFMTKADEKDAQFMVSVTESNMKEIKMAQLALTNFRVHEVKELAEMLLADHTKFLKEIKDLALRKEISIPEILNEEGESEYKIIKEKKGAEFDEAYCDAMIANHEAYILIYEKAAKECADSEIKDWANLTLATLRDHVEFSKQCKKNLKKIEKI